MHRAWILATLLLFSGCIQTQPDHEPPRLETTSFVSKWHVESWHLEQEQWRLAEHRLTVNITPVLGPADFLVAIDVETLRTSPLDIASPPEEIRTRYLLDSSGITGEQDPQTNITHYFPNGAAGVRHEWETPVLVALEFQMGLHEASAEPTEGPGNCSWLTLSASYQLVCHDEEELRAADLKDDHAYVARPATQLSFAVHAASGEHVDAPRPLSPWIEHAGATSIWLPPTGDAELDQRFQSAALSMKTAPGYAQHEAAGLDSDNVMVSILDAVDGLAGPAIVLTTQNEGSRFTWTTLELHDDPFVHVGRAPAYQEPSQYPASSQAPLVSYEVVVVEYWHGDPDLVGWKMLFIDGSVRPYWIFGDECLGQEEGQFGIASAATGDLLLFGTLNQTRTPNSQQCAVLAPSPRSIPST